jgi:hypothetical protein
MNLTTIANRAADKAAIAVRKDWDNQEVTIMAVHKSSPFYAKDEPARIAFAQSVLDQVVEGEAALIAGSDFDGFLSDDIKRINARHASILAAKLAQKDKRIAELRVRDGNWMDGDGACRVCDGEIPHGHTENCDVFKLEQEVSRLNRDCDRFREGWEKAEAELKALRDDAEMLNWLDRKTKESRTGISFDYLAKNEYRFMRQHFIGEPAHTLRGAIRLVMDVEMGKPLGPIAEPLPSAQERPTFIPPTKINDCPDCDGTGHGSNFMSCDTCHARPSDKPFRASFDSSGKLNPPPFGEWHRSDWTPDMLPEGGRPLLDGEMEQREDQFHADDFNEYEEWNLGPTTGGAGEGDYRRRTSRPLPPAPNVAQEPTKFCQCPAPQSNGTNRTTGEPMCGICDKPVKVIHEGGETFLETPSLYCTCTGQRTCTNLNAEGTRWQCQKCGKENAPLEPKEELPKVPAGFHAATVEERLKVPEGSLIFSSDNNWVPSSNIGEGASPIHRYACPNIRDGTAELPSSYHIADEKERYCLPEGSIVRGRVTGKWQPTDRVGGRAVWELEYACPDRVEFVPLEAGDFSPQIMLRAPEWTWEWTTINELREGGVSFHSGHRRFKTLMDEGWQISRDAGKTWQPCSKPAPLSQQPRVLSEVKLP